jgi:hypothetical protein
MSFIVTLYVREGIVMASDSRLALHTEKQEGEKRTLQVAVGISDSNYKTFLAPNNVGISIYGAADIKGVPISGFIESFINEQLQEKPVAVNLIPDKILAFFKQFDPHPETQFHIAGYLKEKTKAEQHVWLVDVAKNHKQKVNPNDQQGASWGGEGDIMARLLQPIAVLDEKGNIKEKMPYFPVPFQFFTLQDAIDFATFSVQSTINAIRFQPRPKTVGGPVDVLVIKPTEAFWVQRKELHA